MIVFVFAELWIDFGFVAGWIGLNLAVLQCA